MKSKHTSRSVIAILVSAVVAVVLAIGLTLSGSPGEQRAMRLDNDRTNNLVSITYSVDTFWREEKRLPLKLEELQESRFTTGVMIQDPVTGIPYPYRTITETTYELCATFDRTSPENMPGSQQPFQWGAFWKHGTGEACYTIDVQQPPDSQKPVSIRAYD